MRQNIVAGNWKMNKSFQDAEDLIYNIIDLLEEEKDNNALAILCPSFPYLELATDLTEDLEIAIGAQNVASFEEGAYTGEVSAGMLKSIGVEFCIIGHSERRKYFKESDEVLAAKVDRLLDHSIQPIFCCGEVIEEREKAIHFNIVENQLKNALWHLDADSFKQIIIAYEPVWAIGTGLTASPEQAQEMHAFIRQLIKNKYTEEIADSTSILYGGSCNAKNAAELFSQNDVDGGLIGGASLKHEDFVTIIKSFQ